MLQKFKKLIEPFKSGDTIPVTMVQDVIDNCWHYIEKDGLSNHFEYVRIVFKNNQKETFTAYYHAFKQKYIYDGIGYDISEILCWCELPIFNKAEWDKAKSRLRI